MIRRAHVEQARKIRLSVLKALLVFYLLPLFILTFLAGVILPESVRWSLLSWGFFITAAGSACLYSLLLQWEGVILTQRLRRRRQPSGNISSSKEVNEALAEAQEEFNNQFEQVHQQLAEAQNQRDSLGSALHEQEKQVAALQREKQELERSTQELKDDLSVQLSEQDKQIGDRNTLLEEYQKTISDQREVLEKKAQQIEDLQSQIKDLKYELKTVLNCAGSEEESAAAPKTAGKTREAPRPTARAKSKSEKAEAPDPHLDLGLAAPSQSRSEAQAQLKRCVDIAQKLTGARHLAGDSSRFRDLSADGYALDLRRLCDSLRSEQTSMIVLYSQREQRLLFTNNQVRGMLGWSPEKFVQNFGSLIVRGQQDLANSLKKVGMSGQGEVSVVLRSRSGEDRCLHCLFEVIPTGIFKAHIIGVLYPVSFRNS